MVYLIKLSEESDHLLRQLCESGDKPQSEPVFLEDFLSAFVEEQLDELFVRRERRKAGTTKKTGNAVRSAKERAKTWSEAAIATRTALEAIRTLVAEAVVAEAAVNQKKRPGGRSRP